MKENFCFSVIMVLFNKVTSESEGLYVKLFTGQSPEVITACHSPPLSHRRKVSARKVRTESRENLLELTEGIKIKKGR